jgi:hypothetical protein
LCVVGDLFVSQNDNSFLGRTSTGFSLLAAGFSPTSSPASVARWLLISYIMVNNLILGTSFRKTSVFGAFLGNLKILNEER